MLAHELGHNFGMSHDFDESHGGNGSPCDGTGICSQCDGTGIMSYGSYSYDQWSTCSRSDWEKHYSGLGWGEYCLDDISGETASH